MSIRAKATTIIIMSVLVLFASIFGFSKLVWQNSVSSQEDAQITEKLSQIEQLINNESAAIDLSVSDWALFNDTYQFMARPTQEYINSNLQDPAFKSLRMNFIIYIGKNGKTVYEKGYDLKNGKQIPIPDELNEHLKLTGSILKNKDVNATVHGLIPIKDKLLLISSNPISNSAATATANGTLVMARYLTTEKLGSIEKLTNAKIKLWCAYEASKLLDAKRILNATNNQNILIDKPDQTHMTSYKLLQDVDGEKHIILEIDTGRETLNANLEEQKNLLGSLLACLLMVFAVFLLLIQKIVIEKIERLNRFVKGVSFTDDTNVSFAIQGSDEIASLSTEINNMLHRISEADKKIKSKEKQLEMVLEGSSDGFWDWDMSSHQISYSDRTLDMLGYQRNEITLDEEFLDSITHPDDLEGVAESLGKTIVGIAPNYGREYRLLTRQGIWKWFLIRGKVVEYNEDGTARRMAGTVTDISDRKKTEEEIRYLSYTDKLTGLFNRAYFEKELEYIDTTSSLPYTFIIGDLNGLKLANDVFGHDEGDRLLQEIAEILRKSCRESDVIARWGGDEFAILLIPADQQTAERVCERIKENCNLSTSGMIKPSIGLGMATKLRQNEDVAQLVKDAETRMYQAKTMEGKQTRQKILASLKDALDQRSFEDELHCEVINEIGLKFGEALNLSEEEMDKLELLGVYHDLGEITLPESILKKQGPLDEHEWEEIRKHPETGYRIAKAIPEIAHIADYVVKHHEHYDGTGYPFGLKGSDIPLVARIFAIADAYAAMMREVSYKPPVNNKAALAEIMQYRGTWFDPVLVDEFMRMFQ